MTKSHVWWIALIASGLTVLLSAIVPTFFYDEIRFDPNLAVNTVTAVAIILTAAFAAANLLAFREAADAEFTPVLDLHITWGTKGLNFDLRNIGRGYAAGVTIVVWWMDKDLTMWISQPLTKLKELFAPGEEETQHLPCDWMRLPIQQHLRPGAPTFIVELRYRDGRKRPNEQFLPFEFEDDDSGRTVVVESSHSVPSELSSVDGKRRLLNEEIERITKELDAAAHGLVVTDKVSRRIAQIHITRNGEYLWGAQVGSDESVSQLGIWLARELKQLIEKMSDEPEGMDTLSEDDGGNDEVGGSLED